MKHEIKRLNQVGNPIISDEIQNFEVRALSWRSPYGEMMLHGKIETRSWNTNYRGLVLICLSKKPYQYEEIKEISGDNYASSIVLNTIDEDRLDGYAIGIGRLIDSRPMTKEDESDAYVLYKGIYREKKIGKASGVIEERKKRQYCHIYEDVRRIRPFEWTGTQGWSVVTMEEKAKIHLLK